MKRKACPTVPIETVWPLSLMRNVVRSGVSDAETSPDGAGSVRLMTAPASVATR